MPGKKTPEEGGITLEVRGTGRGLPYPGTAMRSFQLRLYQVSDIYDITLKINLRDHTHKPQ